MKNDAEELQPFKNDEKKNGVSRRSFLLSSSSVGAGAVVASCLLGQTSALSAEIATPHDPKVLPANRAADELQIPLSQLRSTQPMSYERVPGKTVWYFPDGYLPDTSDSISHEALCVLNLGSADAKLDITLYYEDRDPIGDFSVVCASNRTNHIRMDQLISKKGKKVQQKVGYAISVSSNVPVMCQYTRVDATKPSYTLMTTMGL